MGIIYSYFVVIDGLIETRPLKAIFDGRGPYGWQVTMEDKNGNRFILDQSCFSHEIDAIRSAMGYCKEQVRKYDNLYIALKDRFKEAPERYEGNKKLGHP